MAATEALCSSMPSFDEINMKSMTAQSLGNNDSNLPNTLFLVLNTMIRSSFRNWERFREQLYFNLFHLFIYLLISFEIWSHLVAPAGLEMTVYTDWPQTLRNLKSLPPQY